MKTILLTLVFVSGLFAAYRFLFQEKNPGNEVSVAELKNRVGTDTNLVVIDVRTLEEVTGPLTKIKQAIHIPLHELQARVKELEKYKNKEIAVICRSGNRSRTAQKILIENGYNAKNVPGGMNAYTRQ